jgi:hypothetical protein
MALGITLTLVEGVLGLVGGLMGLSIGTISFIGYRKTGSPALLRLTLAFVLLFLGFTFEALTSLIYGGMMPISFNVLTTIAIVASLLETAGYFFLAFSHIIAVRTSVSAVVVTSLLMIPLGMPAFQISAALESLSFYLLLYGALETGIAFVHSRRSETMIISLGLALLAISEFVRWVSYLYPLEPPWIPISLSLKILGFATFFIPVVKFVTRKETV